MGRPREPRLLDRPEGDPRREGCATLKILLEGRPGIGKTTVARSLVELLRREHAPLAGFTTEEIRERGSRRGFALETVDGERATLAHVDFDGPRVGRYRVDVQAFERLALPALADVPPRTVVVIDELGKMELLSEPFRTAVTAVFETPAPVVATVQLGSHPFTDALKRRPGCETIRVGERNRSDLPRLLASRLSAGL